MNSTSPLYTIAVTNYNMGDTIGQSVESMLTQIDERFEVLVVDGGSTDDSVEVLRNLQTKYDNLKLEQLPPDSGRYLGEARNISVRESNTKYVLLQLDADDYYETGIVDFVEIYHQLENQLDFDFYLKGNNINMASRRFLLELGPYRNLPYGGEDLDLWRRLFAQDGILWLNHDSISHEIGRSGKVTKKSSIPSYKRIKRSFGAKVAEFQTGISFWSYLRFGLSISLSRFIWYLCICTIAYIISQKRQRYDLPEEFKKKGALIQTIEDERRSLSEIESHFGVNLNYCELSPSGRNVYIDD